ncbi:hypothetical protein [uncultured Prevotella sp.]|uniref:hypothetical protein n=1 Tax=uncultured Prevotella sp. TaxID=159272 RepID=UPI0025D04253|nr:hypothetical protein [uncultured Prevotella sp.]
MIYKAKEGSKAYEYIKSICEAEDREFKSYIERVEEAVGFELNKFGGYMPDSTLTRICKVTSILVDKEEWEQLDKKLWKKEEVIKDYVRIVPIKRTKQGKAISAVLSSYNAVTGYWRILKELGLNEGSGNRITLPQLRYTNGHCFIRLGDNVRADKDNPDLVEITMSEYERLIKKE